MTQKAEQTALAAPIEKSVEYQAFGSNEKVKLSIAMVKQWLVKPTRQGKLPSDGDVMRFIMLCKARQLNPWEGDAFLVGYDGQGGPEFNLITAHQAFLKRAEAHPAYDGMRSGVIVENANGEILELEGDFVGKSRTLVGGWCDVYRKDQKYPKKARLKLETFDKQRSLWKTNAAGMIVKCSEADAMRGAFPNTLGGLYNDAEVSGPINGEAKQIETVVTPEVITEDQRVALGQLARATGADLARIVTDAGFGIMAHITTDAYPAILDRVANHAEPVPEPEMIEPEVIEPEVIEPEVIEPEVIEAEVVEPESELDTATEDLRSYVVEMMGDLSVAQRKNLMVGKHWPVKATYEELEAYRDALEGGKI